MRRNSFRTQYTNGTQASDLSEGSREAIVLLQKKLVNFYKVVDPSKLEEETKVNELVLWARRYSEAALVSLMQRKYGLQITEVDSSEQGWQEIRDRLTAFYQRHDKLKNDTDVEKIFLFTRKAGLAKLNERLVEKYGVPLHSVAPKSAKTSGFGKFKEKYKHVLQAESQANIKDEVIAFYNKHDPNKHAEDMQRVVTYAAQNGRKAVNKILMEKYGSCLDDVTMVEGNSAKERKHNLRKQLEEFYAKYDTENQMTPEKLERMCEWGVTHYEELNQQLRLKYGYDLDSKVVDPVQLREKLFLYFSDKVQAKTQKGEMEALIQFAEDKGLEALNQKLLLSYGAALEDDDDELRAQKHILTQQTPKMSRLSVKSIRRSLSKALSLGAAE